MQYGLIGKTLKHSYSPEIHNKISGYDYELLEISPDKLADFLKKADFKGINVTIPYKETVIPYLYRISKNAENIGSVNTIVNKNGNLYGYNTDFLGMTAMIVRSGILVQGKKVVILGTGGTSKTAYSVFKTLGASQIVTVSRTKKDGFFTYDEVKRLHCDAQILINTTPCGMYPDNKSCPLALGNFKKLEAVFDVIYNPLSTALLQEAKSLKIPTFGGLYMLVAQAVYSSAIFFDKENDNLIIDKIYEELLKEKQNIVLIGMPSSGKTTIGKTLSLMTGKPFLDTDTEIIRRANMPILQIFEKYGEKEFRKIETEVVYDFSKLNGHIIATGGGVPLNSQNIYFLKQNGITVFLDRSLKNLIATADRPLSSDRNALEKLYNIRRPIYKKTADLTANSDLPIQNVAEFIRKELL